MSNGRMSTNVDPEDMFADTRMSFGDHLADLQTHLWRAVKSFIVAMIFALVIGKHVVVFISRPVEQQLAVFNQRIADKKTRELMDKVQAGTFQVQPRHWTIQINRNELRAMADLPPVQEPLLGKVIRGFEAKLDELGAADLIERQALRDETGWRPLEIRIDDPRFKATLLQDVQAYNNALKTFNITEAFFVYFKVSLITGLIIASPLIFYHIWSFIAAGLYPHEKRLVNYYLPFSIGLFLAGAAICQFFVIPKAIEVLLSFNEWMGLEPDLRLSEWLNFAIMMPVIFGISFQTPLVMLFLFKIGIMDVSTFRGYRRIAWFVMAVFAAIITPTVDPYSMLFLWVPMGFLYELGILLCMMQPQTPFEDVETPQTEEMVEV